MNFLSHFFFDGKNGAPYYNLGLVLPDLMGISERGWKLTNFPDENGLNEEGNALKQGMQLHIVMDHFFHNSRFFQDATEYIKEAFRTENINDSAYRLFFVAHILLELMMDRLIIKADPGVAYRFYNELGEVRHDPLSDFFDHSEVDLKPHFWDFLQRFLSSRYALSYTDDQRFIYALNRIFERVGHPVFEGKVLLERLNSVIFEVEKYIDAHWVDLEQELKTFRLND